jgi:hypothetical protein
MSDAELIAAIVAKAPQKHRARIQAALESGNVAGVIGGGPEVMQLATTLLSRHAVTGASALISDEDRRRSEERAKNSRQLFVALTGEEANAVTPAVSIVRSPGDQGVPLVLVRSDATARDVDIGIRTAAAAVLRNGASVSATIRYAVRSKERVTSTPRAYAVKFLDDLRHTRLPMEVHQISGIGRVNATSVRVAGASK